MVSQNQTHLFWASVLVVKMGGRLIVTLTPSAARKGSTETNPGLAPSVHQDKSGCLTMLMKEG